MELRNFYKLLLKHKYTLIAIPVVAIIITYFLVRNQPDVYSSQAQIATGIVDQTQQVLSNPITQESRVAQEFSNLIEMMRSKKMLDQVSYQLILHDLTSNKPYRKPSKLLNDLSDEARRHAFDVFTDLYKKKQSLSLFNRDQNGLNQLLQSMQYDDKSLLKTLLIYRAEASDFINVQFDAEDPELSAYVVNTLCKEFITYYTSMVRENQRKAVNFLADLLREKQDSLAVKTKRLREYKIANRVLNLSEQATTLYGQISDFETQRQAAEKDVVSTDAAIRKIDSRFDPSDRQYLESSQVRVNSQIVQLDEELKGATDAYVESGFDESYKARIDSLKRLQGTKVLQSSDKYVFNPLTVKQNLVQQKMDLQNKNVIAKNSISPINSELSRLNERLDELVPHEAVVGSYEKAIDVAQEEYLSILSKYNQTSMEAGYSTQLRQVITAMPGLAQPSKKMLLVMIGGVVTFAGYVLILFGFFFFDNTIKTPKELANRTKVPVLGHLNLLSNSVIDFKKIWDTSEGTNQTRVFKNLLRSIRFEIDNEMHGNKILLINSMLPSEGKTLLAISLAYSRAIINQKVLLIDGNFEDSDITDKVHPQIYLEDYLKGKVTDDELRNTNLLNVWGNRGGDVSLFEIKPEAEVKSKFDELKHHFDIIIIESSALDTLNRSKEWVVVADKVLAVFESGQNLSDEMKQNISYLKSIRHKFIGWVLNKMPEEPKLARKKKKS
ncbi:MAG: Wzz/FepE/Etk N-terminal domain-containing protein [Mucilaginibacter sp.]